MNDELSFQEMPSYVERSRRKPRLLFVFIAIFLLAIALGVGLYFLGARNKSPESKVAPVPSSNLTPTKSPTTGPSATQSASVSPSGKTTPTPIKSGPTAGPSPKAELDRSKLTIAVLNGSGTPGAAKGISSYLNGLGYTIKSVGNADNFTYTNITIKIKKSKSAYLPQLKKDLAKSPTPSPVSDSVDDSISTDAEVIVGK